MSTVWGQAWLPKPKPVLNKILLKFSLEWCYGASEMLAHLHQVIWHLYTFEVIYMDSCPRPMKAMKLPPSFEASIHPKPAQMAWCFQPATFPTSNIICIYSILQISSMALWHYYNLYTRPIKAIKPNVRCIQLKCDLWYIQPTVKGRTIRTEWTFTMPSQS